MRSQRSFSLIEVVIASTILFVLIAIGLGVAATASDAVGDGMTIAQTSDTVQSMESVFDNQLRGAGQMYLVDNNGDGSFDTIQFQSVTGYDYAGAGPKFGTLRALKFSYETGETNNGTDDDRDGLVDEGYLELREDRNGDSDTTDADEQVAILVRNVLEGVTMNFIQANGTVSTAASPTSADTGLQITFSIARRLPTRQEVANQVHTESRTMVLSLRNLN